MPEQPRPDAPAGLLPALPPEPQLTTPHVPPPGEATGPYVPGPDELLREAGPYRIEGEIGQGGMGVVFRAKDPGFDRTLAIKVLRTQHQSDPELERRFLEEAHITGQLQHPGIAPVHAIGRLSDGRPFFSMKLIQGRTLSELLQERSQRDLPRFLGIFAQVCQTLGYAHAQGVIHRDVKPSNVMVGAFGEVQMMDWGLAKIVGQAASLSTSGDRLAACPPAADHTQAGTVVGTFAYMPPEQARGEQVDERADVFSLGAVLCQILSGRPPYTGGDHAAVWNKARGAELTEAFARLDGCGADAELIALAKRCLAVERDARLRNAGAVAQAVADYLTAVEERARQAEQERAAAQARAEEAKATAAAERRAKRRTVWLAVAVLLLVVAGGTVAWVVQQQHAEALQREIEHRQGVVAGLNRVQEMRKQQRWKEARVAAEQTQSRLGESGPDDLRQRLGLESAALDLVNRLDGIQMKRATLIDEGLDYGSVDRDYALAFQEASIATVGEDPAVIAARVKDSLIAGQLLAALDGWAGVTRDEKRRAWLFAIARKVDPNDQRDRLRDPEAWKDLAVLKQRVAEAKVEELTPSLVVELDIRLRGHQGDSVFLLRAAQRQHPSDFWLARTLGMQLVGTGKPNEAAGYYRVALALRPEIAHLWMNLGSAMAMDGQLDEATAYFRKANDLDPKLPSAPRHSLVGLAWMKKNDLAAAITHFQKDIEANPNDAETYRNLGVALYLQKKLNEAVAAYHKALTLRPTSHKTHYNLGIALADQKKLDEAVAAFRKAIAIEPNDPAVYRRLGVILCDYQNRPVEAETAFRKAIALQPDDALAYRNLGTALTKQKKLDEAVAALRKSIVLQPGNAQTHCNLGQVLDVQKKPNEAVAAYQKAVQIKPDYYQAHYNLGIDLLEQQKLDEAVAAFRKVIDLKPTFAEAHCNLGHVLNAQGQIEEALVEFRKGHELGAKQSGWPYPSARWVRECEVRVGAKYTKLGAALADQKKPDEAVAAFRRAVDLQPDDAKAHYNLGIALREQKKPDEAVAAFRKAISLQPDRASAYFGLGTALSDQKKLDEAVAAYRKAIQIQPDDYLAHYNLGLVLREQKKLDEAVAAFRKADQLLPGHPLIRNNLRVTEQMLKLANTPPTPPGPVVAELKGKLTEEDSLDTFPLTKQSRHKAHAVPLQAGKTYQIDLTGDFNTFLRLEDSAKKPLLYNDDLLLLDNLNARLIFRPEKKDDYRLVVTSFGPALGTYTLTVREVRAADKATEIKGELTKEDKKIRDKFVKRHTIELAAGKPHTIEVESAAFDTFLVLLDPTGKQGLAQNGGALGNKRLARIDITPNATETYAVLVTSAAAGETGAYTVRVEAYEPVPAK